MVLAAVWTLIGVIIAGLIAFVLDSRGGRRSLAAELRQELRDEIGGLRAEVHSGDESIRQELRDEIGGLRAEMHSGDESIRQELRGLGEDLRQELRAMRVELRRIGETQAEMNGQLVVLRTMAHTHDVT